MTTKVKIIPASHETSERYTVVGQCRTQAAAVRKARITPNSVVIHEAETVITHERWLVGSPRDRGIA